MTRKRYTKMLMSHGVSRNRANELASHVFFKKGSYEEGYKMWLLVNGLDTHTGKLAVAFMKAAESILKLGTSIDGLNRSIKPIIDGVVLGDRC